MPAEFDALMANNELTAVYEQRPTGPHQIGYTLEEVVTKANPNNSNSTITFAEMVANVGLSRFRNGFISRGRQNVVQAKVKEFGEKPSWKYQGASFKGAAYGYGVKLGTIPEGSEYKNER
jgi:hypothetical protein